MRYPLPLDTWLTHPPASCTGGLLHLKAVLSDGTQAALSCLCILSYLQPRTAAHPRLFSVHTCFSAWIRHPVLSLSQLSSPGGEGLNNRTGALSKEACVCLKTFCSLSGPHMLDEGPENLKNRFPAFSVNIFM